MLQRTLAVLWLSLGFGWADGSPARAEAPGSKLNIVYILADDLGYGDLGSYNADSKIPTPHLDKLAKQGMRFTDAHSSAVCTPTRYALLTGRYSWRSKMKRGVQVPWGGTLIPPTRLTLASMLKAEGYATAGFGKWHLGWDWPTKDGKPAGSGKDSLSNVDFSKPVTKGPTELGFDRYFGVDLPNFPPFCFIENDHVVGVPSEPSRAHDGLFNLPGPMIPGWKLDEILPEVTRRSVRWVEENARAGKPFFLYFPLPSPHYPVVPSAEFKGKSQAGDYGDFVYQTDWCVGQVLDALERTGVAENTLVVFTSDNGPEVSGEVNPGVYDRVTRYGHRSMGELRGAKRDLWEAGHRVPFLVRWPGRIKPGSVSDETICQVDMLATVGAILGSKIPGNAGEDSVSFLPVLLGQDYPRPLRPATVFLSGSGKFAIRKGDWILIDTPTGDDNGRHGEPDWLKRERGYQPHKEPGELYNLREDLAERHNRYRDQPDLVNELKKLLDQYKKSGRSTPGPVSPNDTPVN